MLDGATPAPLLLLLFWLIANGELFCLFRVDETCLKPENSLLEEIVQLIAVLFAAEFVVCFYMPTHVHR